MQFIISDSLNSSLEKLSQQEARLAKTTVYDLQANLKAPGLNFHRVERARDANFWSVRVNQDLRIIIHKTEESFLLCYVGHHDQAYKWAQNRKGEIHPKTGAFQFVEIRERVEDIVVTRVVDQEISSKPIFEKHTREYLALHGVPEEWLDDVMSVTDEDQLLDIVAHLPAEASDALLVIATGGTPAPPVTPEQGANPFEHPDAKRRFLILDEHSDESLARYLDQPLAVWRFFLHPSQREIVDGNWRGPFRAIGAPGTGKTVCAMHRCKTILERSDDARVLFTTYDKFLAQDINHELKSFLGDEQANRCEVFDLDSLASEALRTLGMTEKVIKRESGAYRYLLTEAAKHSSFAHELGNDFLEQEFTSVIMEQGIYDKASYVRADRRGRVKPLTAQQKLDLFPVFEKYRELVRANNNLFQEDAYWLLINKIREGSWSSPFSDVIVDEVQDFGRAGLTLIAALAATAQDQQPSVFMVGDQNQRISGRKYSFADCGLKIRGRARRLRKNYRTSSEIFSRSLEVLTNLPDPQREDEDDLSDTFSAFSGPTPILQGFSDSTSEMEGLLSWLNDIADRYPLEEVCVVSQDILSLKRIKECLAANGMTWHEIRGLAGNASGRSGLRLSTLDRIKGLEFSAVAIVGMGERGRAGKRATVPSDEDIRARNRLFVGMTRAKTELYISYYGALTKLLAGA